MTAELATFLAELTDACEREYLETARISQDRAIPSIELMQTASLAQDIKTWTEI